MPIGKYHDNVKKKKAKQKKQKEAQQREMDARAFLEEYMQFDKDRKKAEMAKSIINWATGKWDSALKKLELKPKRRDQKIFMTKQQWNEYIMKKYAGDIKPWLTGRPFQEEPKLKF